jgi:hypothetical protein
MAVCNNHAMQAPHANESGTRIKALLGHDFFAPAQWQRRAALWTGGILVGLAAIAFAQASNFAYRANILSYWAGIPGGIFSPALAVGAGMGHTLAGFLPATDASAIVLLGMASFLSGVTQAPITAAVISLELTANQNVVIPLMAVCLLSRGVASMVSPKPVYRAFADRLIAEFEHSRAPEIADTSIAPTTDKENDPR